MDYKILKPELSICRLPPEAPTPQAGAGLFSVTRTNDELSVVCEQLLVPDGVRCERAWRCLRVAGSMDFAVVGVLAALVTPLAEAGIGIFAFSTFDTDYLLVKNRDWPAALEALRRQGHSIS